MQRLEALRHLGPQLCYVSEGNVDENHEIEVADNAEKGPLPKKKAEPKRTSLKKPVSRASEKGPKKKTTNVDEGKPANP